MKTRSWTASCRRDDVEPSFRCLPFKRSGSLRARALALLLACGFAAAAVAQEDTVWVRRFDGTAHGAEYIAASAHDRWGNIYVTGYATNTGSDKDYVTIKYRPNGDTVWVRAYNGPDNERDIARAIAVDNDGNVWVTGESRGPGTGYDYATIRYDSLGTSLWVSRYSAPGDSEDWSQAIALGPAEVCYVTGGSFAPGTGSDFLTIKYGPDGDTLWSRRYDYSDDWASKVIVDSAGDIYVAGTDYDSSELIVMKYGPTGDLYWAKRHTGWANDMALGSLGRVYIVGGYYSPTGGEDFLTIAYDAASGDTVWTATLDGPAHARDGATSLAVGASGRIYVTGHSIRDTVDKNKDFLVVCYQPTGDTAWVRRVPGVYPGGQDYPEAIALDGAERIYVGGYGADSAGNNGPVAVSYDSGGVQHRLARYTGPGGSGGSWCTVSTFGSTAVYLAGYSEGLGTMSDCTVAKYGPFLGIADQGEPASPGFAPGGATIVRGVLMTGDRGQKTGGRVELLDVSGRTVARLAPGANEVGRFAPGIYFVRHAISTGTSTRKVVFE